MKEKEFIEYLKDTGRSKSSISRYLNSVKDFVEYLAEHRDGVSIDDTLPGDLHAYGEYLMEHHTKKAYLRLWGIDHYFRFIGDKDLSLLADSLKWVVHHDPLRLSKISGVEKEHIVTLRNLGVKHVRQMLERGATKAGRLKLAEESGVPLMVILRLVTISDLTRIPGLKAVRSMLYYEAGLDTLDKIASQDPKELQEFLIGWVVKNNFGGSAPNVGEARHAVEMAKFLERIVKF